MPSWRVVGRQALVAARTFALTLAVIYIVLCWLFWTYEGSFVFHQVPRPAVAPEAADLAGFAKVEVPTEDGLRLYGWWRRPEARSGAIVLLTGTGVTLADYVPMLADLAAHGFGVLGIDYRGNGASPPGIASEAGWRKDARAAFDFVRSAAPQAKIAVYGQSMGSGFAVELGVDRPVAGVLLDSAYASVARLFQAGGLPFVKKPFPARLLMSNPIDAEAQIGGLRAPLLIMHGTEDRAIPIGEARRLYAAAREPKEMIEVEGAGHAAVWFGPYRERGLAALAVWTAP
jgi:alpha-beta hydrolase superfamily lysophospholipase